MINKKFLLVLTLLCFNLSARETIRSFDEAITIHKNGWIDVEEKITVNAEGDSIRRGIVREIPLRHRIFGIFNYLPKFELKKVSHNDQPTSYHVDDFYNGKHVYIGSKHRLLQAGAHTYTINYSTKKHIGFFKDYDELYWNVTGNQWRFPIENVRAVLHLPDGIDAKDIKATAYVGRSGSREDSYTASIDGNVITFVSKRPLMPGEAFTIVAGWPKGVLLEPTMDERVIDFFQDNGYLLIILLGLLALIILFIVHYFSNKVRTGTIIPLFEPPKEFTPSMCRYLLKYRWDATCFASEVVALAVKGLLKINMKEDYKGALSFKTNKEYTLVKTGKDPQGEFDSELYYKIFVRTDKLELASKNHSKILSALDGLYSLLVDRINKYFDRQSFYLFIGAGISLVTGILALFLGAHSIELYVIGIVFIVALVIFYFSIRGYTQEGQDLVDQIKGFQLFLRTAETERLKLMAPVNSSPLEPYERFLPYAIALDAEEAWTKAFAPIFKQFEADRNRSYNPVWFYGGSYDHSFSSGSFSTSLSSFVSTLKTTSSPTLSSGFGSGGGAGSGGGGGGGGGW
ncbi:MAG TPA: DUF2207 domain-containing protein [Candidatus Babeliales bacterium]|nr:DUF2207 domain-containing protein [Candidatus Babeliales bacterium]